MKRKQSGKERGKTSKMLFKRDDKLWEKFETREK